MHGSKRISSAARGRTRPPAACPSCTQQQNQILYSALQSSRTLTGILIQHMQHEQSCFAWASDAGRESRRSEVLSTTGSVAQHARRGGSRLERAQQLVGEQHRAGGGAQQEGLHQAALVGPQLLHQLRQEERHLRNGHTAHSGRLQRPGLRALNLVLVLRHKGPKCWTAPVALTATDKGCLSLTLCVHLLCLSFRGLNSSGLDSVVSELSAYTCTRCRAEACLSDCLSTLDQ